MVRHLTERGGAEVFPATRDGRAGSRPIDLLRPETLRTALSGIDAVVHCAVGDRAVTVEGARNLAATAAAMGVRRIVALSSVAVYGPASGALREDSPRVAPEARGYAGWKSAAEDIFLAESRLEVVLLRPSIVYGPGSALWIDRLSERIRSGHWGTFGAAGEGTCNLVHAADVAAAVGAALAAPGIAGRVFNVDGPERMSWNDWFRRVASAIGAPPLPEVPPGRIRARALLALPFKAAGRFRPALVPAWARDAPARSELALYARRATYPAEAARAAMGWSPRISVAEGLPASLGGIALPQGGAR